MEIRRIRRREWSLLREIRLRALADAPGAFASTYDRESRLPDDHWVQRAKDAATGTTDTMLLALERRRVIGMTGAGRFGTDRSDRHVWGMWVEPGHRGHGIGRALLDAAVGWAWAAGARRVTLWVAEDNLAGRRLYRSAGFRETGIHQPLPSNPGVLESRWELHRPE